jgi:hypothetical protein
LIFPLEKSGPELFGFLDDFFREKMRLSDLKLSGSKEYCPFSNMLVKVCLNGLYGKLSQKTTDKGYKTVPSGIYFANEIKDDKNMVKNSQSLVYYTRGGMVTFSYERKEEAKNTRVPIQIGMQIPEVANYYLWDVMLKHLGVEDTLYVDTDSVKFKASVLDTKLAHLKNTIIPHDPSALSLTPEYATAPIIGSTLCGGFKNEYSPKNNHSIFIKKKTYASFAITARGEVTWSKIAAGGISRYAMLVPDSEPFIGMILAEKKYWVTNAEWADKWRWENPSCSMANHKTRLEAFTNAAMGYPCLLLFPIDMVNKSKDNIVSKYVIRSLNSI